MEMMQKAGKENASNIDFFATDFADLHGLEYNPFVS